MDLHSHRRAKTPNITYVKFIELISRSHLTALWYFIRNNGQNRQHGEPTGIRIENAINFQRTPVKCANACKQPSLLVIILVSKQDSNPEGSQSLPLSRDRFDQAPTSTPQLSPHRNTGAKLSALHVDVKFVYAVLCADKTIER